MADQSPKLALEKIELLSGAGLSVAATGKIQQKGQDLHGLPSLQVGFGKIRSIPTPIQQEFADVLPPDGQAASLWIRTAPDGAQAKTAPAWFVSLGGETLICGLHRLQASAVSMTGARFSFLRLKVFLKMRGVQVLASRFEIVGKIRFGSSRAGVDVANLQMDFRLKLDTETLPDLGAVLKDPVSLLDGAFRGEMAFTASGRGIKLGSLQITGADVAFNLRVHSDRGNRKVEVDTFGLQFAAPSVSVAGVAFASLRADAHYTQADGIFLASGDAEISLPPLLAGDTTGTTTRSSFTLVHRKKSGHTSTQIDLSTRAVRLHESLGYLGLDAASLNLELLEQDGSWQVLLTGGAILSWSRAAQRLRTASVLELPDGQSLPDLRVSFRMTAAEASSSGNVTVRLDLVRPNEASAPEDAIPYEGPLDPLPLRVRNAFFEIQHAYSGFSGISQTQITGGGTASSTTWLRNTVPFDDVTLSFAARAVTGGVPKLVVELSGGFPNLRLPALQPGKTPLELIALRRLSLSVGEQIVVESAADLLPNFRPGDLAPSLGLTQWNDLVKPLGQAAAAAEGNVTMRIEAPLRVAGAVRMEVILLPTQPPSFHLLKEMGKTLTALGVAESPAEAPDSRGFTAPHDLFEARPGRLRFVIDVTEEGGASTELSVGLDCKVLDETFDLLLAFRWIDGRPELSLVAGVDDPVRIVLPTIDLQMMAGPVDLDAIAQDLQLSATERGQLRDLHAELLALLDSPGASEELIIEIFDFGLKVLADQPPVASGRVRLVQIPSLLSAVLDPQRVKLGLNASPEEIYISFENSSTDPLLRLPIGNGNVAYYLYDFTFGYAWSANTVNFGVRSEVKPNPSNLLNASLNGTGVYLPGQSTDLSMRTLVGPTPVPVPEFSLSFEAHDGTARGDLGLQAFVGTGSTRYVTAYLREARFSPSYFLLMPGLEIDGGLLVGGPNPAAYPDFQAFQNAPEWNGAEFTARLYVEKATVLLINPVLGLLLNPLAIIPPFVTPMPPYWLVFPAFMMDLFADRARISINIPSIASFDMELEKPLPALTFQALLEFGALVMTGFARPIPSNSALRYVLRARMKGKIDIPLVQVLTGDRRPSAAIDLEANLADVVDGVSRTAGAVKQVWNQGAHLLDLLKDNPNALVRMVPLSCRRFTLDASFRLLDFEVSGSLMLVTPEELRDELVLFHENKRKKKKGMAASELGPPRPSAPAVNIAPELTEVAIGTFKHVTDTRKILPTDAAAVQPLVTKLRDEVLARQAEAMKPIDELRQLQQTRIEELAGEVVDEMVEQPADTPSKRSAILAKYQIGNLADQFETLLAQRIGAGFGASPPEPRLLLALRQDFVSAITEGLSYEVMTDLEESPVEMAHKIVEEAFIETFPQPLVPADVRDVSLGRANLPSHMAIALPATQAVSIRTSKTGGPAPLTVQLTVEGRQIAGPVAWTFPDGTTDTGTSVQHTFHQPGNQLIQASVTIPTGVVSAKATITVDAPAPRTLLLRDEFGMRLVVERHIAFGNETLCRKIETIVTSARPRAEAVTGASEQTAFHAELQRQIENTILESLGDRKRVFTAPEAFRLETAAVEASIAGQMVRVPSVVTGEATRNVFDGTRVTEVFASAAVSPQPEPGPGQALHIRGFHLTTRGVPPWGQPALSVPVSSPAAPFRVQRIGGNYRLVLLERDGSLLSDHPLPQWFAGATSESPQKAALLEQQLVILQKEAIEDLTPEERKFAEVDEYEQADSLYQTSILSREEYLIKPTGGRHGPLYLADLLRSPNAGGDYLLPLLPVLVGGVRIDLWGNQIRLCGLLAGPDNIFLSGFAGVTLRAAGFELGLQGEFHVLTGNLWQNAASDAITPDSLSFQGSATLRRDGETIFDATASGFIKASAHSGDLQLDVSVRSKDSVALTLFGTEVVKLEWDGSFDFRLAYAGGTFSAQANSPLNAQVVTLSPEMKQTVIVPETTVCSYLPSVAPPGWYLACVTSPEVSIALPTGNWVTNVVASITVGVSFAMDTGGFRTTLQPPGYPSVTLEWPL